MSLLERFVAELPISPTIRHQLTDPEFQRRHALYLRLPELLAPAYPTVTAEQRERLSVFGYLYFRFLLAFDQVLDGAAMTPELVGGIFGYFAAYEAALRGLCDMFPLDDPFWAHFDQCKREYAAGNLREKQLSATRPEFTVAMFEELAAGKSAVCLAIVHALDSLAGRAQPRTQLLALLRHLHIGLQCLDDIDDFRTDLQQRQFTYAQFLALRAQQQQPELAGRELDPAELEYLFYASQAAHGLYDRAMQQLHHVATICRAHGLNELLAYVEYLSDNTRRQQHQAQVHVTIHTLERGKETRPFHPDCPPFAPEQIPGALDRCLGYLRATRTASGHWPDVVHEHAETQHLATAFIGLQLLEHADAYALALEASDSLFPLQQMPAGWLPGAQLGLAVALHRRVSGEACADVVTDWLGYQNADGSWVGFRDVATLRRKLGRGGEDVAGWLAPHACLTALNAWALRRNPPLQAHYRASCAWLAAHQRPDGSWGTYWWASDLFSTALALLALPDDGPAADSARRGRHWLREQQQPDGSWSVNDEASTFYTGLALQALAGHADSAPAADRAAAWLIARQLTDGSWFASPVLRVPHPATLHVEASQNWRAFPFGFDVLIKDQNRAITTATAFAGLAAYYRSVALQLAA